jgi:hypothetical protein
LGGATSSRRSARWQSWRPTASRITAGAHRLAPDAKVLGTNELPAFDDASPVHAGPRAATEAPPRAPTPPELAALLTTHRGNVAAIARELGRDPVQIYRWLKRFALDPNAYR